MEGRGAAAGLPCPQLPGERSALYSGIHLATWLGSGMEGPGRASPGWGRSFLPPDPRSLSKARERGRGFLRQRHISLWGECASTGAEAPGPPRQAQVAEHSAQMQVHFRQEAAEGPIASLPHSRPHSCPREAGQGGRWGPAALGGGAPGRLDTLPHAARGRLVSWQRHVGTALDGPARRPPCSSGVFPPLFPFHRGQFRLQDVKQACPELPAHGQSYRGAHYCVLVSAVTAAGQRPRVPPPARHRPCIRNARCTPCPCPHLTFPQPARQARRASLHTHTHSSRSH